MKDKVCACIITYNIDEKIKEVVNSIVNQVENVIIIDNGSNSRTIKILNEINKMDKVNLVFNKVNNGIAKALNQGVIFAKENKMDWIITLDHDSICDKNMIKNMLQVKNKYLESNRIGILAPQVFETRKRKFISSKDNKKAYTEVKECIQSGALFNISVFDEVGYFNENLFIYHVDYDFCLRILEKGYRIIQCNSTILYHEEGYKIEKNFLGIKTFYNNYSSLSIYYITRNTVYMARVYSLWYLKRILKDFVYILLYDKNKKEKLLYWKMGLIHGITRKYGSIDDHLKCVHN